jgi:hypothetical protein
MENERAIVAFENYKIRRFYDEQIELSTICRQSGDAL